MSLKTVICEENAKPATGSSVRLSGTGKNDIWQLIWNPGSRKRGEGRRGNELEEQQSVYSRYNFYEL